MVQWLRLHTCNAGDMGLIPGQGTKILNAARCSQKKKKKSGEKSEAKLIWRSRLWILKSVHHLLLAV